tara:strand:- start:860 stop:1045 length:186 start_codon:yes stop_codon:yes gene_type:complete
MKWISQVEVLEGVGLTDGYYVRPEGSLGTVGWYPVPWQMVYIPGATTEEEAVRIAKEKYGE